MAVRHGSLLMRTLQPPSFSRHCHNCHHQPSAPPLQSFMWSTWNARISSFFSTSEYKNNKMERMEVKKTNLVSLAWRTRKRELDPPRRSMEQTEWQVGVEKHTRQFRNLYSISPLVETQTTLLASHFSGWHIMLNWSIQTCHLQPTREDRWNDRQLCAPLSGPCRELLFTSFIVWCCTCTRSKDYVKDYIVFPYMVHFMPRKPKKVSITVLRVLLEWNKSVTN